ncbi:MAG: helix-turn-helix domain-containing protein [Catonella sp.]
MIKYDNLWKTMKEKGITQYRLMNYHDFSQDMFRRMKKNLHCSTYTLSRLCEVLDCNIEDIITFVPDENAEPIKIVTKAELLSQKREAMKKERS